MVNSFLNRWGVHRYEAGYLRYPTTDEIVLPDGGRRQEFQGGVIYVAFQNAIGSAMPNGPLRDKYNTIGGLAPGGTLLGYPLTDEFVNPDQVGRRQGFERGVIYWSPSTGAHPITGLVLYVWAAAGFETGKYGYPAGDQTGDAVTATQQFQRDSITFGLVNPVSQQLYDCKINTEHPHRSSHQKWRVNVVTTGSCTDPKKRISAKTTLVGPVDCVRGILMMGCSQPATTISDSVGDGANAVVQDELRFATNLDCEPGDWYAYTEWEIANADGGVIEHGPVRTPVKEIGKSPPFCEEKPEE